MVIEFIFAFITGLFAIAIIGNGVLSRFKKRIEIAKISDLENFILSIGIGLATLSVYGYFIDLIVNTFLIPVNGIQWVLIVGIPLHLVSCLNSPL